MNKRLSTILVVCADEYRTRIVRQSLEIAGYRTEGATQGGLVLEKIHQGKPALVLLDWLLPDLSGLAVVRLIRADVKAADIPLILMGSQMSESDRVIALEAGADICLAESFQDRVIAARVRALLRRTAAQGTPQGAAQYAA